MTAQPVSHYVVPRQWVRYDIADVAGPLIEARTAAGVLSRMAYLPQWIEQAHEEQLRLEAVGTARIEGAEFTQRERDEALAPDASARTGLTHSQRQLRSANATYRWLRSLRPDQPVTAELILDIHRRIVTGCDDDRCEPGATRPALKQRHLWDAALSGHRRGRWLPSRFQQVRGRNRRGVPAA